MNRMERRAAWLARHRQPSSPAASQPAAFQPAASQPAAQRSGHNVRAPGFDLSARAATASARSAVNMTASARASVNLHIGELVLHGFAPHDRYRIGDAVQHELARLLMTEGAPPALRAGGERASLNAGSFNVAQGAAAKSVGHRVAQAVYGELKR